MAGWIELNTIAPGTPVFDAADRPIGTVAAVEGHTLRVGERIYPAGAIARVDPAGIFLHPEGAWEGADTGGGGAAPIASGVPTGGDTASGASSGTARGAAGSADDLANNRRIVGHEEGQVVIPLAEERPVVGHREVDLGEIIVLKRVIEEERLVPVTIRREVVERVYRAPDGTETIEQLATRVLDTPSE